MNKWFVIYNPRSGTGRGGADWPAIEQLLRRYGIEFEVAPTERRLHAVDLVRSAVERGFDHFVAVGGDGTMHEVANGILLQTIVPSDQITLALIAVGTGNDWGRTTMMPQNYEGDIRTIAQCRTILQDVGLTRSSFDGVEQCRYFVNECGTGLDADVNRGCYDLREQGRSGKMLYLKSLFKSAVGYKASCAKVTVDGRLVYDDSLLSTTVGLGRFNGGGMSLTPLAVLDDGLFDITLIDSIGLLTLCSKVPLLFNGRIYDFESHIHHFRGKEITIEQTGSSEVECDGEPFGSVPVTMTLHERALRVVVGADYNPES